MSHDNVELVERWIEACNAGDPERVLKLVTPGFEMHEAPALPGAHHLRGRDALMRYFEGWQRQWSDGKWHADEIIDAPPHRVVLDARLALLGLRSSVWVERRWAYVFTIEDGLLSRQDGFDDRGAALAAVGMSD